MDGKPKKLILVVDDEVTTLRALKRTLEAEYEVAIAGSAENAFAYLKAHTPDLILLDYMMPGTDGKQTLLKLREKPETQKIPVIFLTALSDADTVRECLSLDAQGYLLKPINAHTLLCRVSRFFSAHL
ncbi:MAG TPA: response regulator [Oscillospiraceae bacterium]|nr:response regulator [Oscillospiraceae bacterium]